MEQSSTIPGGNAGSAQGAGLPNLPASGGGALARVRWGFVFRMAALGVALIVATVAAILTGLLYFNLERHPLVGRYLRDRLVVALEERLGPGMKVSIDAVDLRREAHATVIEISGFDLRQGEAAPLISAPSGIVTLDSASLLALRIIPRSFELTGLRVALEIDAEGKVLTSAQAAPSPNDPGMPPILNEPDGALGPLREAIGAVFAGLSTTRDAVGGKLPELGVRDAALVVTDRRTGRVLRVSGINSALTSQSDGVTRARTEVRIGQSMVAMDFELSPQGPDKQTLRASTEHLDAGDLFAALGLTSGPIDSRTHLSLVLDAEVNAERKAVAAKARIGIGASDIVLNPQAPPLALRSGSALISWSEGTPALRIDDLLLEVGKSRIAMTGEVHPPAQAADHWQVTLKGGETILDGLTPTDPTVKLDSILAELALWPSPRRLDVSRLALATEGTTVELKGAFSLDAANRMGMSIDLAAKDVDARTALRIWPPYFAPETRMWLVDHVLAGKLTNMQLAIQFPPDVLTAALADKPLPETSIAANWSLANTNLRVLPDTPLIRNVTSTGWASARAVRVDISGGAIEVSGNRRLMLQGSHFAVPDTTGTAPEARIRARFSGGADTLAEIARSPGLQAFVPRVIDPARIKGAAEGEVNLTLKLARKIAPGDMRIGLTSTLKSVAIDAGIGGKTVEAGEFQLAVDRDTVLLKGDARISGTSAAVEVKGSGKTPPVAQVTMLLDDAARARQGVQLGTLLTGPIQAKFSLPLVEARDNEIAAEFDFTRTAINDLIPGWSKPAGAPGRAKAAISEKAGGGWSISKLELDAGSVSVRGGVEIGKDGSFNKAQFSSFKLSPGDNAQLDAERNGAVTRIAIRGNAFDARPFLRSLQTGSIDKANARDTELTLKTTVLSGFGGEIVTNPELRMEKRGAELRRFDLNGRFDGGPLVVRLQPQPRQPPLMKVESEDAGAFLRFFDIYSRMRGGNMLLTVTLGSGTQRGAMMVRDFTLRDEPAMKRLVSEATTSSTGDTTRVAPDVARRLQGTRDVPFTKMTVAFARTPGRLDVQDAVIWGPEIGGSISGTLDYVRDRVSLTGTFVPAYSLNNMFAQVPVLGPLLGGGRNEGLFAVRYSIAGQVSAPTLSIDPLTAIAPGFLRKLIDFRGHAQQRGAGAPATTD